VFRKVKVFGERNSGTNYLERLLKANFDVELLPGTRPMSHTEIAVRLNNVPKHDRAVLREAIIDDDIQRIRYTGLGWKHGAPDLATLRQSEEHVRKVLFVTIFRHPYTWLRSLHRRPYHSLLSKVDFSSFIRSPWVSVRRDNIDRACLDNPVQLWNAKSAALLRLGNETQLTTVLICYEDLLARFDESMERFSSYGLTRQDSSIWNQIHEGTKDKTRHYSDYVAELRNDPLGSGISIDDIRFIDNEVDQEVATTLRYELLNHREAKLTGNKSG
jgi:hypothetical protein